MKIFKVALSRFVRKSDCSPWIVGNQPWRVSI